MSDTIDSPSASFRDVFERQRAAALRLRTSTAAERIEKLKRLRAAVIAYTDTWCKAGWADFRKPPGEVELTEVLPVVVEENTRVRAWLRENKIRVVATTPAAETLYTAADLRGPLAVVMGSEQYGLSEFWLKESDLLVRIPMAGQADSLNVAMAAIITLFEAVRQRNSIPFGSTRL